MKEIQKNINELGNEKSEKVKKKKKKNPLKSFLNDKIEISSQGHSIKDDSSISDEDLKIGSMMFFAKRRSNNHNSEIKEEEDEQNDGSSAKKEEEQLKFQNVNLKAADLGDEDEIPDEEDEE